MMISKTRTFDKLEKKIDTFALHSLTFLPQKKKLSLSSSLQKCVQNAAQIFQRFRSHLIILDARLLLRSKFHTHDTIQLPGRLGMLELFTVKPEGTRRIKNPI
jgi:hypothetical protein